MLADICIPLTLKIMGIGRPLSEAERLTSVIVIWVVLLCTLLGYTIACSGSKGEPGGRHRLTGSVSRGNAGVTGCGIFPVVPGTAVGSCPVLLHW